MNQVINGCYYHSFIYKNERMVNMKVYVVMCSYQKRIEKTGEERSGSIYRPGFMFLSEFDTKTQRYARYTLVPLKYEYIALVISEKLIAKNSRIVVWSEDEKTILYTLLKEAGFDSGKLKFIPIKRYFKEHGITYNSLASTAKELRLETCPRDGVTSFDKVFERFDMLRRIFKKIIIIDGLNLIDGILI